MDMLETTSPVEALAFHYAAGAAGSLWAWVAVLAAALSVWRFRGATARPDSLPPSPPFKPAPPISTTTTTQAQLAPPPPSRDGRSTPKSRFTAYFTSDDDITNSSGEEDGEDERMVVPSPRWKEWEVVRRRGDLGWYKYQDMAALNGSVVRLWDGGRRRRLLQG